MEGRAQIQFCRKRRDYSEEREDQPPREVVLEGVGRKAWEGADAQPQVVDRVEALGQIESCHCDEARGKATLRFEARPVSL